jgi:uncharacterized protein
MQNKSVIIAATALCAWLLSSCTSDTPAAPPKPTIGRANPASVNCIQRGGTLQIVEVSGGQAGICRLPNGTQCDEWALLRGECPADGK